MPAQKEADSPHKPDPATKRQGSSDPLDGQGSGGMHFGCQSGDETLATQVVHEEDSIVNGGICHMGELSVDIVINTAGFWGREVDDDPESCPGTFWGPRPCEPLRCVSMRKQGEGPP